MSKLAKMIEAVQLPERAVRYPSYTVDITDKLSINPEYLNSYRLNATFGAIMHVPEDHPEALACAMDHVRHLVVAEVFGEFKKPLLDLRHEIMKKGDYALAEKVSAILDQMFEI